MGEIIEAATRSSGIRDQVGSGYVQKRKFSYESEVIDNWKSINKGEHDESRARTIDDFTSTGDGTFAIEPPSLFFGR